MSQIDLKANAEALKARANLGMGEFIALCAALAAVAAMSIDIVLPALPAIGGAFGIIDENDRQLVILIFTISFGLCQLFYGPVSDRFGRRPLLVADPTDRRPKPGKSTARPLPVHVEASRTLWGLIPSEST